MRKIEKSLIMMTICCLLTGGCSAQEIEELTTVMEEPSEMEEPREEPEADGFFVDEGFQNQVGYALQIEEGEAESSVRAKLEACEYLALTEGANKDNAIHSIEDLVLFPQLKDLVIDLNSWDTSRIGDFSPILKLRELETLFISYSPELSETPVDFSFLSEMTGLKELYLPECGIADISFLQGMTGLERLSLYENQVGDLIPLSGLTNLVELSLAENDGISNVEVIASMSKMEDLGLQYCNLDNIDFLSDLRELRGININGNRVTDISVLAGFEKLERLGISENGISDITPLKNLTTIFDLSMDANNIEDISVLQGMEHLNQLGISNNQIRDLSVLEGKEELFLVNLFGNPIESMKPIARVPEVNFSSGGGIDNVEAKRQNEWITEWIKQNVPELEDYECIDYSRGDINQNGLMDLAFVVDELFLKAEEDNESDSEREYARGERCLFLLLQNQDGDYHRIEEGVPELSSYNGGGMRGDPYGGTFLEKGQLVTVERGGSSGGWSNRSTYRYEEGRLIPLLSVDVEDYSHSAGYHVWITDEEKGTWQRYVYAMDGYRIARIWLEDEKHPYFKAFPQIDLYRMEYNIHHNLRESQKSPEEALEMVREAYAPEAVKEKLPYPKPLKADLERLKGIALPDIYYVFPSKEQEDGEDYIYYSGYGDEEGRPVHIILMKQQIPSQKTESGWEEKEREFLVDDEDGTITEV